MAEPANRMAGRFARPRRRPPAMVAAGKCGFGLTPIVCKRLMETSAAAPRQATRPLRATRLRRHLDDLVQLMTYEDERDLRALARTSHATLQTERRPSEEVGSSR